MKRFRTWWLWAPVLYAVPYVVLMLAGSAWLFEHGFIWAWIALTAVTSLAGFVLVRVLRKKRVAVIKADAEPEEKWPPAGQEAWKQVEAIAERLAEESPPLDEPEWIWSALHEIVTEVARRFYPRAKQPELEVPMPYILRIVEIVAADLREALLENVPGSHMVTVGDWRKLHRFAERGQQWYNIGYAFYRIAHMAINPGSALMREGRDMLMGRFVDASTDDLKKWAIRFAVRKAGYYAIELYSGRLTLEGEPFRPTLTAKTEEQGREAAELQKRREDEPLRILIAGQVKAGKSSLINALFGEELAATDIVPRTRYVEPFVLAREGVPQAVILDTAGYAEDRRSLDAFGELRKELLNCDLVLLACTAMTAARDADRKLLDDLREFFLSRPDRRQPPIIAVLTHIDQLRPRHEWDPPYDLEKAETAKAQQIRAAVEAVAHDLGLEPRHVIPVCLAPGRAYNVEELLVPAILASADDAERVKYLRCFAQHRQAENWRRLWKQAKSAGRLVWEYATKT
jgi:predicted GTPase